MDRGRRRQDIANHFLLALEDIVWRYREQDNWSESTGELDRLRAEAITAEVSHHLTLTRESLHRIPLSRSAGAAEPRATA